jgi:hypothetical protein
MEFSVEKYISNFIESQFPGFYQEEGQNFILFTKAYYEWMESSGNPIAESRKLFDYRDIDNTIEDFLLFFQKKYLYGIPFNVIVNKRLLLKHILDVYRSKGSIQCYKLLFKLVYNEDIEVYLPGIDILRVSDGTWVQPQYIEVTNFENVTDYMGKNIVGLSSGVTATVENVVRETYNDNSITLIYFSNILPKGGLFDIGERIVPIEQTNNPSFIANAPSVLGSISTLEIVNGGRDYKLNDIIKVIQRDPVTNELITYGKDGYLKVTNTKDGGGEIFFDLVDGGFGFAQNSAIFIYRNDITGTGASFDIGSITNEIEVEYNTDIISNYLDKALDAVTYNFPEYPSSNLSSTIQETLSFSNNIFGTIGSLTNINVGKNYTKPANVFVRSVTLSDPISANVIYSSNSTIVNFTSSEQILTYANTLLNVEAYGFPRNPSANVSSTLESTISLVDFYNLFVPNEVIALQANSSNSSTLELQIVKEIANLTSMILYGPPTYSSTNSAQFRAASVIFPSNFLPSDELMNSPNQLPNGLNEKIRAFASVGNSVVTSVTAYTGKGFLENETVSAGLYGLVSSNVQISVSGNNYSNDDLLIFSGSPYARQANGYLLTNSFGSIIDVIVTDQGSGYLTAPELLIQSKTGNGAILKTSIREFNYDTTLIGKVKKIGNGKEFGYYTTTRGFLNSDKYIQDSFYYQDYSYEIRVSRSLNKYKDILYETFHSAGSELFGKYLSFGEAESVSEILYENNSAVIS